MPPTETRRSRVLWNDARRPDGNWTATARAILYELQPIRLSTFDTARVVTAARSISSTAWQLFGQILPGIVQETGLRVARLTARQWAIAGGVGVYFYIIRIVHKAIEAGPLVILVTLVILMFTIGLGDEDNRDGLSAYSVFNRGFQQLLGSVDADSLVQQYAGGAMAMQVQGMGVDRNEDGGDHAVAANVRQAEGRVAAPDNDDEDVANNEEPGTQDNANRTRRSNKKARNKRRRTLDVRREMERQRQAAAAMGFQEGTEMDAVAMNQLIEDQIVEEEDIAMEDLE